MSESITEFFRILGKYRGILNHQQIKTIRGIALSGDLKGAEKSLARIIKRSTNDSGN